MRSYLLKLLLLAGAVTPVLAQKAVTAESHTVDLGLSYTYLRSNILPGCNCVSLNGASAEAGVALIPRLRALADLTLVHRGGITPDGYALTQITYTFGVRVFPLRPGAKLQPFSEVLLGGAHASGTLAPLSTGTGTSNSSFALQAGGGLAYRLGRHFTLRAIQADYMMTTLSNDANDRQNDFRLSVGVNYRLPRP